MNYLRYKPLWVLVCITGFLFSISSCNKYNKINIQTADIDSTIPVYSNSISPQQNAQMHLGRVLFYDKSLSKNNSISCASCHKQEFAFADNTALSQGFEGRKTSRNSIAIQNLSTFSSVPLFWDGRETSLESLIGRPIANHIEMGMDDSVQLMDKLNRIAYIQNLCEKSYGANQKLTMKRLSSSMAYFLGTIRTTSRFDLLANVPSTTTLNAIETRGQLLFNSTYECNNCHHPSSGVYSNLTFRNIGLDVSNADKGRMAITNNSTDNGLFKVPDLHNVTLTAPYMHDGRFATLNDVLNHYSHGIQNNPNLSSFLKNIDGMPLSMKISDGDKEALIAFLATMTDYSMLTNPNYSNPFKYK